MHPVRLLFFLALLPAFWTCKRPAAPPPEVVQRYQAHADQFCRAVLTCMKEEVEQRLANSPERRDMVTRRMDRDLCVENQYNLIGELSVDPRGAQAANYEPELYEAYGECARVVAESADCETLRGNYRDHPACRRLHDNPADGS